MMLSFGMRWSRFAGTALMLVLCAAMTGPVVAQNYGTINGTVKDETGNPLVGTNVFLLGTRLGSGTNIDGEYKIERVPPGMYTLQVSFIGYKSQQREVTIQSGGTLTENFELAIDVLGLDEVIVTGMGGTQIKEKLGVTIDRVDAQEVSNSDVPSVIASMAGKVSNVEITSSSGQPGASTYIRIRGANTMTGGTQPLFVVDGIPINNETIETENPLFGVDYSNRASDVNPEDIESVEILKGAAAAAIYGSRAANGVVLITTKSGIPGRTRVEYKLSYSFDDVNRSVPLQRKYGQGQNGQHIQGGFPHSWGPDVTALGMPTYDHAWELFETGHILENNLTISGGTDFTTFFMSVGHFTQNGAFKGSSDYERTSVRLKGKHFLNEKLSVGGNIAFSKSTTNYIQKGSNLSGLFLGALRTPPEYNNLPYLDPETGLHRSFYLPEPTSLDEYRLFDNPFFVLNELTNKGEVGRVYGNVHLSYDPLDWININYTLGTDYSADNRLTVFPPSNSTYPPGYIIRDEYIYQETDLNLVATVTMDKWLQKLNSNVAGTMMLGHNLNWRERSDFFVEGYDMSVYDFKQLDNTGTWFPDEYQYKIQTESYYGQMTLDLYDQLFLTAAIRNDGSSTFSQSERRHWFPKASAAWEFTRFGRFPDIPVLNYGKLRVAYGEAGQQPDVYSMITAFVSGIFEDGWGPELASTYNGLGGFYSDDDKGQDKIKPERSKEIEVGTDLAFWNSRIGFNVTYYQAKTEDVIFSFPLAPSTGFEEQVQNAMTIMNKGIELGFNLQPVKTTRFTWDMRLLYARNRNEVTDMAGADFAYISPGFVSCSSYAIEGKPLAVFRGEDFLRFGNGSTYEMADGTIVNIDQQYSSAPAGALFIGEDGYPVLDPEIRIVGDPNPDWTGSIRNDFTLFNKIRISSLFDIKQGGDIWNGTKGALYHYGTHKDTETRGETRVFDGYGPGQGTAVVLDQDWYRGTGGGFNGPVTQFIEDGSYIKLRELSVSYNYQHEFLRQFGINSIDIRLSGRNLKVWTDYSGIDPETNLSGTTNNRGFDYFNNPQTKSYVLTLRFHY